MLSLLSLLLTSGTVLKVDTEKWTAETYPDPRKNLSLCNTWENSTLCDPDHILTDYWRAKINENIKNQVQKLRNSNISYADNAPLSCYNKNTSFVQIFVLLAKRIKTTINQTITETDLTAFGNNITQKFKLDQQTCKNFLILIGVETAKLAYVRTGKDLKLPFDLMQKIFHDYHQVNSQSYMENLNLIIDKIGKQIFNLNLEQSINKTNNSDLNNMTRKNSVTYQLQINNNNKNNILLYITNLKNLSYIKTMITDIKTQPWWLFLVLGIIFITFIIVISITVFWMNQMKKTRKFKI